MACCGVGDYGTCETAQTARFGYGPVIPTDAAPGACPERRFENIKIFNAFLLG